MPDYLPYQRTVAEKAMVLFYAVFLTDMQKWNTPITRGEACWEDLENNIITIEEKYNERMDKRLFLKKDNGEPAMEMKQIYYFIVCARCGSFSKAAEQLYTTQPNVSKVIKAMEDEMDIQLFVRNPRGIELTEEGVQVYKYAEVVYDNMQNMLQIKGK